MWACVNVSTCVFVVHNLATADWMWLHFRRSAAASRCLLFALVCFSWQPFGITRTVNNMAFFSFTLLCKKKKCSAREPTGAWAELWDTFTQAIWENINIFFYMASHNSHVSPPFVWYHKKPLYCLFNPSPFCHIRTYLLTELSSWLHLHTELPFVTVKKMLSVKCYPRRVTSKMSHPIKHMWWI